MPPYPDPWWSRLLDAAEHVVAAAFALVLLWAVYLLVVALTRGR